MEVEVRRHGSQRRSENAHARRRESPPKEIVVRIRARDRCAETDCLGKLLTPAQRRRGARAVMDTIGLSQRKACAVATCNRKTLRRVLQRTDDAVLLQRLKELAAERRRFGYRRLDIMLRRDGIVANHKRIYRVYSEANLQVRKRLKRRVALSRGDLPPATSTPNERWSLDFVHDTLQNSRRLRTLNVVDDFTREALAMEVDTSISGSRVTRVLDRIAAERGMPTTS
jgi:putative transposase